MAGRRFGDGGDSGVAGSVESFLPDESAAPIRYSVVTAARDELHNLGRLRDALVSQSSLPQSWVIVDDGSTDGTWELACALADEHGWISVVSHVGRERPTRGGAIAEAYETGIAAIESETSVVVLVDADVSVPSDYFELLLRKFEADESLGIASGIRRDFRRGRWQSRYCTGTSVESQCRAFRRECLDDVLPFEHQMGWDGIDAVKASLRGWKTQTLPDLWFEHHRRMGRRDGLSFRGWSEEGRGAHYMGYRWSYLFLRSVYNARHDVGAFGLLWGYLESTLTRRPRCPSTAIRKEVRRNQRLQHLPARMREASGRRRPRMRVLWEMRPRSSCCLCAIRAAIYSSCSK
jgi:poly-beta-1,6-N-acetyl-D-glucosamine synthase